MCDYCLIHNGGVDLEREVLRDALKHAVVDKNVHLGTGQPKKDLGKRLLRTFQSETEKFPALVWAREAEENGKLEGADE